LSKVYTFRAQARADVLAQQDWYISELAFDAADRFVEAVIVTADEDPRESPDRSARRDNEPKVDRASVFRGVRI
jgi:hypothetical protein